MLFLAFVSLDSVLFHTAFFLRKAVRQELSTPPTPGTSARRTKHPADLAAHAWSPWDELRVWDPGD